MDHYEQFDGFSFRPWMGVAAGALLLLAAGSGETHTALILRGLGMTLVYGSLFVSHRRRKRPGDRSSSGKLKTLVFAGFCALLTLGFIIEWIYNYWFH
jgi:hypothetical protein